MIFVNEEFEAEKDIYRCQFRDEHYRGGHSGRR